MEEKRKNKRLDIGVKVEIERIDEANITTVKYMEVEVTNKETIDTVFKVVRVNQLENGVYEYGCIFVGMTDTDALKIEIYQLFSDAQ